MILLFIFLISNFYSDFINDSMIFSEKNSKKEFIVSIKEEANEIIMTIHSDRFDFIEFYSVEDSMLYMTKRKIKIGIFSKTLHYDPPRLRMKFPLRNGCEWEYIGKEVSFPYKKSIHSKTKIIEKDSNFIIRTTTERNDKSDTTEMILSNKGEIKEIKVNIPVFWNIYKLFGFKNSRLCFIKNEEY